MQMTFVCPEIQPVLGDLRYLALRLHMIMPQCFLCAWSMFLLNVFSAFWRPVPTCRCRLSIWVMELVHHLSQAMLMVHAGKHSQAVPLLDIICLPPEVPEDSSCLVFKQTLTFLLSHWEDTWRYPSPWEDRSLRKVKWGLSCSMYPRRSQGN